MNTIKHTTLNLHTPKGFHIIFTINMARVYWILHGGNHMKYSSVLYNTSRKEINRLSQGHTSSMFGNGLWILTEPYTCSLFTVLSQTSQRMMPWYDGIMLPHTLLCFCYPRYSGGNVTFKTFWNKACRSSVCSSWFQEHCA